MAKEKTDLKKVEEKVRPILKRTLKATSHLSLETVAGVIILVGFGVLLGIAIGVLI